MTIRRVYLPLLVALSLAAGCANGGSGQSAGAPSSPSASSSSSSSAPASIPPAAPTEESGATKAPAGGVQTLTGTITAGVEPNCLLLDDHLLIISDPQLQSAAKAGATVTVTGRAEEGMMTTCQQGTPFLVATVRAN